MAPLVLKIGVSDKGNPALKNLNKNIKKLGKTSVSTGDVLKNVLASAAVLKGIALLGRGIRVATSEVLNFEKAIKQIEGISQVVGADLEELRTAAKDLAMDTEFSATSIAKSMLEITKMGFSVPDTLEAMPSILNLATASMSDLGYAATNSISILKAFNMNSSETERVANVVSVALNQTALNFEDYMEAMKFVAPISKELNVSFEETSAILGHLADIGLKGSIGGTSLKNMMLNLLEPSEGVAKALEDVNFEGMTLTEMLKTMDSAGVKVIDMLKTFDKRALAGSLSVAAQATKVQDLTQALNEQGLTAEEVAEVMRQSVSFQLERMQNILQVIGTDFFEAFGPSILNMIFKFNDSLKEMDSWVRDNKDDLKKFAGEIEDWVLLLAGPAKEALKFIGDHLGTIVAVATGVKAAQAITWLTVLYKKSMLAAAGTNAAAVGAKRMSIALKTASTVGIFAAVAAMAELVRWADRLNDALDRQMGNVSKGWATKEHIGKLQKLEDLYERQAKLQKLLKAANDETGLAVTGDLRVQTEEQLLSLMKDTNKEIKAYKSHFGKTAVDGVKSLEDVQLRLKQINTLVTKFGEGGGLSNSGLEKTKDDLKELKSLLDGTYGSKIAGEGVEKDNPLAFFISRLEAVSAAEDKALKESKESWKQFFKDLEEMEKQDDNAIEDRKERISSWVDFAKTAHEGTMDFIDVFYQNWADKDSDFFEEKRNRLEDWHSLEVAKAGDSTIKKIVAEEKYQQKKAALEKEEEQRAKERRRKEAMYKIATATANAFVGSVGAVADTPGGPYSRLAAGATVLGYGLGLAATVASELNAINARSGVVVGDGNSTSDSVNARLSVGERVLSVPDVDRLGGHSNIDKMLDRSSYYQTSNKNVNVYIDKVVGREEEARALIPYIEQELSR